MAHANGVAAGDPTAYSEKEASVASSRPRTIESLPSKSRQGLEASA